MTSTRCTKEWLDTVQRESNALFHSIAVLGVDSALEYTRCLQALRRLSDAHRFTLHSNDRYRRYDRGDVVWVEFGWPVGHEHRGLHPAVVISRGDTTRSSIITVIPLTSRTAKPEFGEIALGRIAPATKSSTALVHHITTVSKLRILGGLGHLPNDRLESVENEMLQRLARIPGGSAVSEVAISDTVRRPDGH